MVKPLKQSLARKSLLGKDLEYGDRSANGVDDLESARDFIQSIEDFVSRKAQERTYTRDRLGLPEDTEKHKRTKAGSRDQSRSPSGCKYWYR